ncbi:unnamed protein product [Polarella glacialis]|uniref:Uncharacterized protein n=1 Tax=Polarella glacialis TaxID=89957 RepID=A0A813L1M9_POLGL|nr:unnamed protein product [Polarella glacialis]
MYNLPSINSSKSTPYSTFHLCYQDRINKEKGAAMTPEQAERFYSHQAIPQPARSASGAVVFPPQERFPKGGTNRLNNCSKVFSKTFGPGTYAASGGCTTWHRTYFGPVQSSPDVAGPMGLRHQMVSTTKERFRPESLQASRSEPFLKGK